MTDKLPKRVETISQLGSELESMEVGETRTISSIARGISLSNSKSPHVDTIKSILTEMSILQDISKKLKFNQKDGWVSRVEKIDADTIDDISHFIKTELRNDAKVTKDKLDKVTKDMSLIQKELKDLKLLIQHRNLNIKESEEN